MSAADLLREGKLDDALAVLKKEVSGDPADAKHRVFLFQLLCVNGDWERALTQLNVAADMDPATLAMAQMYRAALQAEVFRAEIFQGKRQPIVFGEPPEWIGLMIEALRLTATGEAKAGEQLREQALEQAPAIQGQIDDSPFEWIADADPRLGPILEAMVDGKYYWIPFDRIKEIRIEAPADLRDVIWMPCQFVWANGGDAVGLIPTRYPGSESSEDEQIRLARKTDWIEQSHGQPHGLGQRLFAIDSGDHALMDSRKITLKTSEELATSATDEERASSNV
ncbi:MAG: type VI secretion system accessory protein TagJ [Planctomycetota bacterium]|nr:type VI secretion system accessory protein TagJ [Planctomycetota bacterium]